ncbi:hypothetical protein [Coralloluteibacterium thermophilus]|uniref:HNH endonuclease n=1 Tax=Coralloluteibacterium thermophilum TaxID=2707049 RepID=A0ABV9NI38_9GAMM
MRTKNAARIDAQERAHLAAVKSVPCVICDAPAPSSAHHIRQGDHYTTVALCADCHQGSVNGWHGQKVMWRLRKFDEIDALNETLRRVLNLRANAYAAAPAAMPWLTTCEEESHVD